MEDQGKVRDAIVAASTNPDAAFAWVSEIWPEGPTCDELKSPGNFGTLDAKLMSSLTTILVGDFARRINTLKETEAAKGQQVRGRQVLFLLNEYFSTNAKHGSTYSIQDLFSVKLQGTNLKAFMTNWDTVMAGVPQAPDESILEYLFYTQVRYHRAIAHDIAEYQRAEQGTPRHSYEYLVSAVRLQLERERLETNRERIARGLGSGTGKPAAPATGSPGKGYCIAWNKGGCTKDNCKFKHEVPPTREGAPKRDKNKKDSRGRSNSRDGKVTRKKPPKKSETICKFWKAGRCTKGSACEFKHPSSKPPTPRQATPARSPSKGSDRSKSSRGSKGSGRGSDKKKGPKDKKKEGKSPKATPAAVCIIASMLASAAQACIIPACPSVSFDFERQIIPIDAHGDMKPYREVKQSLRRRFPRDYKGSDSSSAVANARLAGRMLAGAVNSELEGSVCKRGFICDTEFGCDLCIPPDLYAVPAECSDDVTSAKVLHIDWIADTESAEDLLRDSTLPDQHGYMSDRPIKLLTANGESSSQKQGKVFIPELGRTIDPYLVRDTPAVLSVGMRCMNDGYDFIWKSGQKPYFVRKDRTRIPLEVRDYVPYLVAKHKEGTVALPATDGGREGKLFVEDAPTRSSPSSSSKGDGYIKEAPVDAETSAGRDAAPPQRDERTDPDGSITAKERKGAEQLRAEATSVAHQLSHFPKNPFCEVCIKAKMFKPPSRRTGGSRQVKAEKFGDHLTADFLITRGEEEHGMDGEKSSLVIKDVAGFIAVYPSARRTIEEIVRSLQHFVGPNEKVGIFYSDNAPELVAAIKQLQWRHVLDVPYISQTNAVAERAIRSVLEGTRVNLLQAGLHHSYWPHAARHWCHMSNVLSRDGQPSPWKPRFNESFPGTLIPFGTKAEFWIGPRLKPKEDLRFEPSTNPGVFMGYALHPGCMWRKEFLCIPLKALMDRPFDEPIKPLRTNQIEKPSEIRFPNRLRYDAIREGATSLEDLSNPVEYVGAPEAEGADPPKIIEDKSTADGAELDPHEANISRTAGSVLHEGWLAFLASVNAKVG